MPPLDTIIIGAGIAGLTCARELTRRGARVTAFPKHLARDLDIHRSTTVTAIESNPDRIVAVHTDTGDTHEARTVALAIPPAQAAALLRPHAGSPDVDSVLELLEMSATQPTLVTMVAYPPPCTGAAVGNRLP